MSFWPFKRRRTRKAATKNNEAPELDLDVPILETAANPLPQTEIVNVVTPVTDETLAGVDVVPLAHEEEETTNNNNNTSDAPAAAAAAAAATTTAAAADGYDRPPAAAGWDE